MLRLAPQGLLGLAGVDRPVVPIITTPYLTKLINILLFNHQRSHHAHLVRSGRMPATLSQSAQQIGDQAKAPPPEPTPEFLAQLAEASQQLEQATPEEIIRWAVEQYHPGLTMATAFGPEGCVILATLAQIQPDVPVFNLDTGYQFSETLQLRDRIAQKYGIEVELKRPALSVEAYEAKHGGPLYQTNPNQCCFDRKLTVLRESIVGMRAWMSGIRRDQSPDRARAPIVGWDRKFGLVKISPLANSTKQEVWKRILDEGIPYNPLHDRGYPSIGCWPCTRAVTGDTDERAGRWVGFDKTECGLHSDVEQDGSGI